MSTSPQIVSASDEFPDELPKQYEIICGNLVRKAVPDELHSRLQFRLSTFLAPFDGRRSTPGGWRFHTECEIEFLATPKPNRFLPDVAGWKLDVVPNPLSRGRARIPPQWVCEVLSPSTANRDKGVKLDTYHRAHVDHYWLVDPETQSLTVLTWAEDGYQTILTASRGDRVRAEPFVEHELELDWLFDFE
ncbi:MAG: Uma2 family endonuclease [Proteobacteria bacterium]|nr:Uma2 family endonuclease [Pseudomonadota bacterium]